MTEDNKTSSSHSVLSALGFTEDSRQQVEHFLSSHKAKVFTILMTDLEGSTQQQSELGNLGAFRITREHRRLFRELLAEFDGLEVETAGDAFLVVFDSPSEGTRFALEMQATMREATASGTALPPVRVGLHQGEVVVERHDPQRGTGAPGKALDIYGVQVSTAARFTDLAAGGQILLSRHVFDDARAILKGEDLGNLKDVAWRIHGPYGFKGVADPFDVCEVGEKAHAPLAPPLASTKGWPKDEQEEIPGWRPGPGVTVPETNWQLVQKLGEGEFGEVWQAVNPSSKDVQVFKFTFKRRYVKALMREARLLTKLKAHPHPGIVQFRDIAKGDRPPHYLEMEYVDGPTMEAWLAENPPLEARVELIAQVAEALHQVHEAGIYHRDLKPTNILLERMPDGTVRPKVADFGVGATDDPKLLKTLYASTSAGTAGTWDYIAPELKAAVKDSGDTNSAPAKPAVRPNARTDLYSLGLTLFQLAVGDIKQLPGPGWEARIASPELRADIGAAMANDPGKRPTSALKLVKSLRTHALRAQARHWRRVRRVGIVAGIVVSLALGATIFSAYQWSQANNQRRVADLRMSEHLYDQGMTWYFDRSDPLRALFYFAKAAEYGRNSDSDCTLYTWWIQNLSQFTPYTVVNFDSGLSNTSISSDGKWLLTTSWSGTTRIWDDTTGFPAGETMRHDGSVNSASFSPDGKWVVTASDDKTARVWDTATGTPIGAPMTHDERVKSASFSPDGKWVVTTPDDGTARVWDAATGTPISESMKHDDLVYSASFSPDGKWVLTTSGHDNSKVRMWDAATGTPISESMKHDDLVYSASFSPDGKWVLTTSGYDNSKVRMWDAATGTPIGEPMTHDERVKSASFSPDGKWVLTASGDGTARVWVAATSTPIGEPMNHGDIIQFASFSPDGKSVLTASGDGTARVWVAATGAPVGEFMGHEARMSSAALDLEGKWIISYFAMNPNVVVDPFYEVFSYNYWVTSAVFGPDGNWAVTEVGEGATRVWNAMTGPTGSHDFLSDSASTPKFSSDGKRVLSPYAGHAVCTWEVNADKLRGLSMKYDDESAKAILSPDTGFLLTYRADGTIQTWATATGMPLGKPIIIRKDDEAMNMNIRSAFFSPDGKSVLIAYVNTYFDGMGGSDFGRLQASAQVWDTAKGIPLADRMTHEGALQSAIFNLDGECIAVIAFENTAQVWDTTTGMPIGEPMEHDGWVYSASFSPDEKWVVTTSEDGTARVWDAATGTPASNPMTHDDNVKFATFSPNGRCVITVSDDQTARLWDAATGIAKGDPMIHDVPVTHAEFSPDGRMVLTAGNFSYFERDPATHSQTQVWDVGTGMRLGKPMIHDGSINSATFSPDGKWVVTASDDQTVRVWDAATGKPAGDPMMHQYQVNSATFSPDGKWVFTVMLDGSLHFWPFGSTSHSAPDWIINAPEALTGMRLNGVETFVPIPLKEYVLLRRAWFAKVRTSAQKGDEAAQFVIRRWNPELGGVWTTGPGSD